jgi:hypothetical protein
MIHAVLFALLMIPAGNTTEINVARIQAAKSWCEEPIDMASTQGELDALLERLHLRATPILLELARDKNPVARVAAGIGLHQLYPKPRRPPAVQRALAKLMKDRQHVPPEDPGAPTVAEIVQANLQPPPPAAPAPPSPH